MPDRDLFALPFAALIDADGRHLVETHALQVAPSAGTLIELERRVAARPARSTDAGSKPKAVVVGDPFFYGWASQLSGARAEADEVYKELSRQHDVTFLTGREATKPAVVAALRESECEMCSALCQKTWM